VTLAVHPAAPRARRLRAAQNVAEPNFPYPFRKTKSRAPFDYNQRGALIFVLLWDSFLCLLVIPELQ
jgi:hypothetical protein